MTELFVLIAVLGLGLCLTDWRKGLFVCVAAGFFFDPIRKLIPGEPVWLSAAVGMLIVASLLGATIQGQSLSFEPILTTFDTIRKPMILFIALVVVQTSLVIVRHHNVMLAVIGLISYLTPLPAIIIAYYHVRDTRDVTKLMTCYILMCAVASTGVYLAFVGHDWTALRQVGPGLTIYTVRGILKAYPGFLRSPEVMSWHAAASICLLIIVFTMTPSARARFCCGAAVLFFLTAGILTGRRKILVGIILFLTFFGCFLLSSRRGVRSLPVLSMLCGGAFAAIAMIIFLPPESMGEFDLYWQRGMTVFADAPTRLVKLGFASIVWGFRRGGIFGLGAGVGSQGAQHFGGGWKLAGGALEGGLGKVTVELGVPGFLLVLWIATALVRSSRRILRDVRGADPYTANLTYGLLAFLAANMCLFITASQVFGDPFVLLTLGWILGFLLAVNRIVETQDFDRSKQFSAVKLTIGERVKLRKSPGRPA